MAWRIRSWHTATKRHAARGISRASREGSGTDGLRGFERNHGNVASPGRLPSDWLFLAFPPIYLGYSHEFRHAAQHRRHCPIIIYGAAQRRIPRVMAEAWGSVGTFARERIIPSVKIWNITIWIHNSWKEIAKLSSEIFSSDTEHLFFHLFEPFRNSSNFYPKRYFETRVRRVS